MQEHVDGRFADQRVVLDGNSYTRCSFIRCRLAFGGSGPVGFTDCNFSGSGFEFDGAAANTIRFLRGMFHGMGPQGKAMVEQMFETVRQPPDGSAATS